MIFTKTLLYLLRFIKGNDVNAETNLCMQC